MATQIFGKDHSVSFPKTLDSRARQDGNEPRGGAFRGLMFAMLFNLFLVVVAAGVWELWHVLFR